ncbi:hypothetical protein I4F81_012861 [Pyropia yezoensis]|uniref:Uncharacterized protein n=1 Tax=Pyropia yezoensis TaxID=2788 RepID=A0ACC3CK40_PYRYE|nr:hypothetical protein I4F81_012861 [Neopyropia yezoensis]
MMEQRWLTCGVFPLKRMALLKSDWGRRRLGWELRRLPPSSTPGIQLLGPYDRSSGRRPRPFHCCERRSVVHWGMMRERWPWPLPSHTPVRPCVKKVWLRRTLWCVLSAAARHGHDVHAG